jgi:hypothetical protein
MGIGQMGDFGLPGRREDKGYMKKQGLNWDEMVRALTSFCKAHGNCNVPTAWPGNPQLGRWVAVQRYRRNVGELSPEQVAQLDRLGFVWSATESLWNALFETLVEFKRKHGHCDVPTHWPENPRLAKWVVAQRHRKKNGTLSPPRLERLEKIGFVWAAGDRKKVGAATATLVETTTEERLYHVGINQYVQHDGAGPMPLAMEEYLASHSGEYPSHIPLPRGPTEFRIGGDLAVRARRYRWSGKGPLPADVIEYVNENGALPPHR